MSILILIKCFFFLLTMVILYSLNQSLIYSLLLLEILVLVISFFFVFLGPILGIGVMQLFILYFICMSAAESAVVLVLFVCMNRVFELDFFNSEFK